VIQAIEMKPCPSRWSGREGQASRSYPPAAKHCASRMPTRPHREF